MIKTSEITNGIAPSLKIGFYLLPIAWGGSIALKRDG
jgi:hypothetical protein